LADGSPRVVPIEVGSAMIASEIFRLAFD